MELLKRRTNNAWSRLRMDQQHPPRYRNTRRTSPLPSNPTLSLNRSCKHYIPFILKNLPSYSYSTFKPSPNENHITFLQTEAAKPVFGKYYREPKKSGPIPFHLFGIILKSFKKDHYVSDTGDVVYYQTASKLTGIQEWERILLNFFYHVYSSLNLLVRLLILCDHFYFCLP